MKGKVKCIRTDCNTGEEKEVEMDFVIEPYTDKYRPSEDLQTLRISPGVTGYESFIIDSDLKNFKKMAERGWAPCIGTKGTYDKLIIDAEEMSKLLKEYKEIWQVDQDNKKGEERQNPVTKCIIEVVRGIDLNPGDRILFGNHILEVNSHRQSIIKADEPVLICKNLTTKDERLFTIEIRPFYNKIITTKVSEAIERLEKYKGKNAQYHVKDLEENIQKALKLLRGEE